jgi:hypothetical protein
MKRNQTVTFEQLVNILNSQRIDVIFEEASAGLVRVKAATNIGITFINKAVNGVREQGLSKLIPADTWEGVYERALRLGMGCETLCEVKAEPSMSSTPYPLNEE